MDGQSYYSVVAGVELAQERAQKTLDELDGAVMPAILFQDLTDDLERAYLALTRARKLVHKYKDELCPNRKEYLAEEYPTN